MLAYMHLPLFGSQLSDVQGLLSLQLTPAHRLPQPGNGIFEHLPLVASQMSDVQMLPSSHCPGLHKLEPQPGIGV